MARPLRIRFAVQQQNPQLEEFDDEDIVIEMEDGHGKMKVIKIKVDSENGEEITTIEMHGSGKDKKKMKKKYHIQSGSGYNASGIKAFPNPADNELNLEFEVLEGDKAVVTVHDMDGKKIFEQTYKEAGMQKEKIKIDDNKEGIFIVKFVQGQRTITKKIIVH